MTAPGPEILAPLPESRGWRRALAVDRRGGAPRAVVLWFAPAEVTDDPARLAALVRDAEAAARVHHPNAVPSFGLDGGADALALVEPHRRGASLRALLDAGGRLPPDVAARVVADACAGLAAVHAVPAGPGEPLVHGALGPDRLLVADDGGTLVCGLGAGGGTTSGDVRALAAALHECLAGEPPASPPAPLSQPGIPAALSAVVDRALGAVPGEPYPDAEALGAAIAGAVPLAPREGVSAWLEAILPAGEGERGHTLRLLARALATTPAAGGTAPLDEVSAQLVAPGATPPLDEVSAQLVAPGATPPLDEVSAQFLAPGAAPPLDEVSAQLIAPGAKPPLRAPHASAAPVAPPRVLPERPSAAPPPPLRRPPPDAAISFPAPAPPAPPRRSRLPLAAAVVLGAAGFAIGLGLARLARERGIWTATTSEPRAGTGTGTGTEAGAGTGPAAGTGTVTEIGGATGNATSNPPAAAPSPSERQTAVPPERGAARKAARSRGGLSLAISADPDADVFVDGKRAGRSPLTVPVDAGAHEVRLRDPRLGEIRRRVTARGAGATAVRFGRGVLDVTAPPDAEVLVDGRRVGRGSVKTDLWEGPHRIEVRLGEARAEERFTLARGETWTYAVTPTP